MITKIEGAHLTAADRRNIKALMNHPSFVFGHTFKVNGRKTYTITKVDCRCAAWSPHPADTSLTKAGCDRCSPGSVRYAVRVGSTATDDFGRTYVDSFHSTFRKDPA